MVRNVWKRFIGKAESKALILMYHQVCEKQIDPWDLAVEPENFDLHLRHLKSNYNVVPLDELADSIQRRKLTDGMLSITFDDGFTDNYSNAAPLLELHNLPATFFIATRPLNDRRLYWWDELESIIFQSAYLPQHLKLTFETEIFEYRFAGPSYLSSNVIREISDWRYGMEVVNERIDLYLKLWERLKPLCSGRQHKTLDALRSWAGIKHLAFENGTIMKMDHLVELSRSPLFSVGAHTVNHTMLSAHTPGMQLFELAESQAIIQRSLNKQVKGFAYPYGNYNSTTKALVKQSQFKYAVSTESKPVTCDCDLFALPRIHVKNWDTEMFSFQLNRALNECA